MKTIRQKYLIASPIAKVWQALVNPEMIAGWGAGPAVMDEKIGTNFKLWGGDVYGTNTKVVKGKILEQDWYGGKWEKPSKVAISLSLQGKKTRVELVHENIPDSEIKDIIDGWEKYYFGPMREYLEK